MADGFLAYHIRRCNRGLLVSLGLGLIVLIIAAFLARRYLVNAVVGPTRFEPRDLRWNLNPEDELLYYVSLDVEKSLGAGYTDVTRQVRKGTNEVISERVTAYYLVMLVNDRLLIVKSTTEHPDTHLTGALVPVPPAVQSGFVQQAAQAAPGAEDRFLPYMLDTTGIAHTPFRLPGIVGLVLGLPLAGFCLWKLKQTWGRMDDPASHPIARSVSRFGTFEQVEAAISAEVKQQQGATHWNFPIYTPNWVLVPRTFHLLVIHLDEMLWAYQLTVNKSINGISAGISYHVVIRSYHGDLKIPMASQAEVQRYLDGLYQRAPWILFGYSDEMAVLWSKDSSQFCQLVAERRREYRATAPTE